MRITPEQEQDIMKRATASVAGIIKLYKIDFLDRNLIQALTDAYIAGATDSIEFLRGDDDINPDDIPF